MLLLQNWPIRTKYLFNEVSSLAFFDYEREHFFTLPLDKIGREVKRSIYSQTYKCGIDEQLSFI